MTLREERIQELTDLIAARMPPRRLEVVTSGEVVTQEAMALARLYQRSTPAQRVAFDALAAMVREAQGTN